MSSYTYHSRNPLARTNPLRSMPLYRSVESVFGPSPRQAAEIMLASAQAGVESMREGYRYACASLGRANAEPLIRRHARKAMAMRFINQQRARLRAAEKDLAAALARVAALTEADSYATPWLAAQAAQQHAQA